MILPLLCINVLQKYVDGLNEFSANEMKTDELVGLNLF